MVEEPELTALEEHILGCPACAERAEQSAVWVDSIRAAVGENGSGAVVSRMAIPDLEGEAYCEEYTTN